MLGSREALFAFAQTIVDPSRVGATVVVPNPFYQIYEGAALLAGAARPLRQRGRATTEASPTMGVPCPTRCGRARSFSTCARPTIRPDTCSISRAGSSCSSCPTGTVSSSPPTNAIPRSTSTRPDRRSARSAPRHSSGVAATRAWSSSAACRSARTRRGCVRATSPAIATLLKAFLQYRTYHGSAMSQAVAAASIAAWNDEAHVVANRAEYAAKFAQVTPRLAPVVALRRCPKPGSTCGRGHRATMRRSRAGSLAEENVVVLPGSYIAREAGGVNPGAGRIRIALVPAARANAPRRSTASSAARGAAGTTQVGPRGRAAVPGIRSRRAPPLLPSVDRTRMAARRRARGTAV